MRARRVMANLRVADVEAAKSFYADYLGLSTEEFNMGWVARYTSPDGVIIYRKTIGGRSSCYRTGSVGGLVTGFGNADLHGASIMECPRGLSWTRL